MKLKGVVIKFPDKYDQAVKACEIATARLQCLNDKLKNDPSLPGKLSPSVRAKMKKYYNEHLEKCEGIILPVN